MVTLVAVVSVTTGVPGGFGRAVMVKKKKQKLKQLKKKQKNVTHLRLGHFFQRQEYLGNSAIFCMFKT